MLKTENIHVEYTLRGQAVKALDGITLTIDDGEFMAIIGPSGSGKSTLLQVMGGMLSPDQGAVYMEGESLYAQPAGKRAAIRKSKVGFIFQTFNLIPYLTALQNVQIPMLLNNIPTPEQERQAAALLEQVGLGDRKGHKPAELSSGQQQRVALARMLANDPQIIFADEPTGSLDPDTSGQVLDFLSGLKENGKTVIMVTHSPDAARRATRCIRIVDGKLSYS